MTSVTAVVRPPMWLALPPGYVVTGVLDEPTRETALAQLTEGLSPVAGRVVTQALEVAQQQARAQLDAHLTLTASGIHPREGGGVDLSQLVAGVVPVPRGPASAILLAVARSEEARDDTEQVYVRDFAAGTAVVTERRVATPGQAVEPLAAEEEVTLRSIRVALVAPGEAHLAVVELTTRSVDVFAAYRDLMLELVAPSITFDDPAARSVEAEQTRVRTDRLAQRLGGHLSNGEGGADGGRV